MKTFSCSILLSFLIFSLDAGAYETPTDNWIESSPESLGIKSKKVDSLFAQAFEDDATQAVVLIKDGHLIAEQYAEGFNAKSFGTSWSMAKSYYAALIGISIDKGEIKSLDDPVSMYIGNFDDERSKITIRQILNMTSGLEFPEDEHERMFLQPDQLTYAKSIKKEKDPGLRFEYNNVNSMLLGDILFSVTGIKADILLNKRILNPIGINQSTLWKDESGNVLSYCCIDMSARDYSRFGLLFANDGKWGDKQIISKEYIDETFTTVWDFKKDGQSGGGYSLHWWMSKDDEEGKIFNASGKFGQYTFVDRKNGIVFTRITKYLPTTGSQQKWGEFKWLREIPSIETTLKVWRFLEDEGLMNLKDGSIQVPMTRMDGEQKEFRENFFLIVDSVADLSRED